MINATNHTIEKELGEALDRRGMRRMGSKLKYTLYEVGIREANSLIG